MGYWRAIKTILLFYFEKGSERGTNSKMSHIWKVYRVIIFHPIFERVLDARRVDFDRIILSPTTKERKLIAEA
jgi:hypothetical protein